MRSVLVVVVLASPVLGDTPKKDKPKLSKADQKTVREALKKGRGLEAKKKYADAVTAFEDCTKVVPDDAVCLSELGWAAFEGKDLKKAEAATRKSLANQAAPNVRGATLYNLGRIEEELKNKPAAVTAYSESLRVRPHPVVRARLKTLDEKVAATFDPFAPTKLEGPFASLAAYCKTLPKTEDEGDAQLECTCGEKIDGPAAKLAAPFEAVQMFRRTCQAMQYGTTHDYLAVKTAKGWFGNEVTSYSFNRHCDQSTKLDDIKIADVTAAAPGAEAVVRYTQEGSCAGGSDEDDWTQEAVVVVGAGAAGFAATPAILVKKHEQHQQDVYEEPPGPAKTITDISLTLTWNKDGSLDIKGKTAGLDKAEAANLLGKHTLAFP
jgi:hypothetical protein